jgi:Asp/Glu/hydantoin racemase
VTRTVGILHTVPALAPVFHDLVTRGNDIAAVHAVDPRLLATAIREGVTPEVTALVAEHITDLVRAGAEAILVTCSSIGEAADAAAANAGVPVVRVDEAMAHEAVSIAAAAGGRIAVLATLEATLGPTGRLVERAREGAAVEVTARVVEGAAAARASGDDETHDRLVAEAIDAAEADVIVLAQASMARAASRAATTVPVLTSPESGAAALVELLS